MGSFCGTNSQTVINTASNPNVTAQQDAIYNNVNAIVGQNASNPAGLVAPWNPIQTTAVQGLASEATANLPWNYLGQGMVGQGSSMAATAPYLYGQAQQELGQAPELNSTPWNPTQYESPYTQDVINATMGNINRNNAIQQNGALGNAISQGNAFGGDRAGIAMGELARNQALASNQTMAQLQQADFNQASQQANAQQQYGLNLGLAQNSRALQLANAQAGIGNNMVQAGLAQGNLGTQAGALGNQGQAGALAGLGQLYNAGANLQNTQQQQLSSPMTLASWQAATSPGTGATPTSTTYPGSSPASAIAGLGLAGLGGASMLSNLGAFGSLFALADGGRVNKQAGGSIGGVGGGGNIVDRFHQMRAALQAGGAASAPGVEQDQISNNVVPANKFQTAQNSALREQVEHLGAAENQRSPLAKQLAYGMLQNIPTLGAASGGRQDFQDGGDVPPVDSNDPGSGPPLQQFGSPAADPMARKKRMQQALSLGQMGQRMMAPKVPRAPGMEQPDYLRLGIEQLGQMAARGGTISGIGKQDGGEVVTNDPGTGPPSEQYPDIERFGRGDVPRDADLPRSYMPPRPSAPPSASGFDPYRYMQEPNRGLSAATVFLRGLAGIGKRDAHGLLNPVGNAAEGAAEGLTQYDKQRQDALAAALRARQLEAQWEQHQAQMRQQVQLALGSVDGQQTLAAQQQQLAAQRQAEELRMHNRPTWGKIGQNRYGEEQMGWINPNLAPNNPGGSAPGPSGTLGAAPSSVIGQPPANTPNVPGVAPSEPADSSRSAIVPGQPTTDVGNPDLTGDEFLATLPQPDQAQVKAVVEGRFQPPGSFALKSPRVQRLLQWAAQYEPGFDYTRWAARSATAKDFASGKAAQNLTSFNTALEHMDRLDKATQDLHNWNVPLGSWARTVTNPIASALNPDVETRLKKFNIAKTAVVDELTRAFRGTGGNVHDLVQWEKSLNAADSEQSLRGAIKEGMQLLDSRIGALGDQYSRGMGKAVNPVQLLSPKAQQIHDRIVGGEAKSGATEGGPIRKQFLNNETGKPEWHRLVNGQWQKE